MPRTVNYYFFLSSTANGEQGLMTIRRDGVILGTKWATCGQGNAGASRGSAVFKINDSVSTSTLADPPPEGILNAMFVATQAATDMFFQDTGFVPCNVPVRPGDRMSLNQITAGTSFTTWQHGITVTVRE